MARQKRPAARIVSGFQKFRPSRTAFRPLAASFLKSRFAYAAWAVLRINRSGVGAATSLKVFQPAPFAANAAGAKVSENRLQEIMADGSVGPAVRLPLTQPLAEFFTATPRGGSAPAATLDLLGRRPGAYQTICYARVRLW